MVPGQHLIAVYAAGGRRGLWGLACRFPRGKHRDRLWGGGGFGSRSGCSRPYSGPFTQRPCSLVPTAKEVMTRLVNVLVPSVKDAREWLKKTELHLKEEGKVPFVLGPCSGSRGSWFC